MAKDPKSRGFQGAAEGWLRRLVGRSPTTAAADKIAQALVGKNPPRQTEKARQEERLVDEVGSKKSPQQGGAKPKKG
jgi:hypothetical protein